MADSVVFTGMVIGLVGTAGLMVVFSVWVQWKAMSRTSPTASRADRRGSAAAEQESIPTVLPTTVDGPGVTVVAVSPEAPIISVEEPHHTPMANTVSSVYTQEPPPAMRALKTHGI